MKKICTIYGRRNTLVLKPINQSTLILNFDKYSQVLLLAVFQKKKKVLLLAKKSEVSLQM